MEGRSHLLALDADLAAAIADATQQRAAVRSLTATVLTLAAGETLDVRAIAEAAPVPGGRLASIERGEGSSQR